MWSSNTKIPVFTFHFGILGITNEGILQTCCSGAMDGKAIVRALEFAILANQEIVRLLKCKVRDECCNWSERMANDLTIFFFDPG